MRLLLVLSVILIFPVLAVAQPGSGPAQPPAPSPSIAKDSRVFELRTYYAHPGKLEDLHRRFREHTIRLFKKHGMTIVGFWQPTNPGMENTLIYLLAYKDRAARDASWKAFQSDPEWVKVRTDLQVGSAVQSVFMNSTDYGPMK